MTRRECCDSLPTSYKKRRILGTEVHAPLSVSSLDLLDLLVQLLSWGTSSRAGTGPMRSGTPLIYVRISLLASG